MIQNIRDKQQFERDNYDRKCLRIDSLQTAGEAYKKHLKRKQESYSRHYTLTYHDPGLMPAWAMLEELSLGELSYWQPSHIIAKQKSVLLGSILPRKESGLDF